ncbi:hypothetical protein WN944_014873 [Citrus x changshan-huyou]|uniref:Uncharacterized protein n=1 Tax=Citrus x changshan-huyou TaxID=2935761 RepID=A0AAP0M6G4_9ROSI
MVSEAAFIRGSQVLGIIPRVLKPLGSSSDSSTGEELVVSGDLATLEALMTLASWAHLHIHQKPIVIGGHRSLDIGVYFIKADAGEFSSLMFNGTQANALIVLTGQATVNEPFNNHKRPSPGNSSCNEGPSKRVMEARNASADMASSAPVVKVS